LEVNATEWDDNSHVVLAVSTGVDSMVLLHLLNTTLKTSYRKLTCLHVNHGLRFASNEEEQFIQQYCRDLNIPLHTKTLDLNHIVDKGKSIENEARHLRYEWFDKQMKALNGDVLVTAHHQDDQIETIFYRLMTGKSTRSSLGIADVSWREGYKIVRPLLNVSKQHIQQYQTQHQIPFYEDETNNQNDYVRNDIRNRILPAIEQNAQLNSQQLLKLKAWHDEQLLHLQARAQAFLKTSSNDDLTAPLCISRSEFNALDHALQITVLDVALQKLHTGLVFPEKTYNDWFRQLRENVSQSILYSSEKWIIHIAYDKFIIMANYSQQLRNVTITQPDMYQFGHYNIEINKAMPQHQFPLTVRTRKDGDKFKLNGVEGHKKVSRLLIDHKVRADERNQLPVIINNQNEIIAVGTLFIKESYKQAMKIKNMGDELGNA
jgi:tRNA(Ile)-lysidine synthase